MVTDRLLLAPLRTRLDESPAVALLGPRQVGKTTLALQIAAERPSTYFDLELPSDRSALVEEPESVLDSLQDRLVILDEVHHVPEIFQVLRGLIDRGRRSGRRAGRFLLLGSASLELLRQSETLAGRIAYLELRPFAPLEVRPDQLETLWIRGGFPESFLATSDEASLRWRHDLVRSYLHRDVPMFAPGIATASLDRLWSMLTHVHGGQLNAAQLATSLEVSAKTVSRYVDLLVDLFLVRKLQPWTGNTRTRLVRAPKLFVRDSGLLHALLGLPDSDALVRHPVLGRSWEGFAIESIIGALEDRAHPMYLRTSGGAEVDLVLEMRGGETWAIEIKRGAGVRPTRGFHSARKLVGASRSFVVNATGERRSLGPDLEMVGLRTFLDEIANDGPA